MTEKSIPQMAYKKFDKDFVLSDSRVNEYGYRLLTTGYVDGEFARNPIGYYNHLKDDGVLVKWDNVRVEGDQILGQPIVNMAHPRGQRTWEELNEGFLNSASMGKIKFLETELEDNPADPNSPVLVVKKWFNKECSLVDNPGNRGAMKVELADSEEEYDLADVIDDLIKRSNMKKIELTPALLELLDLSDDATQEAIETAVAGLKKGAADADGRATEAEARAVKAEKDLSDLQEKAANEQVTSALADALKAGKITKATSDKLAKQFAGKPADLNDLLVTFPAYQSVAEKLNTTDNLPKDLVDGNWGDLDKAGRLEVLKENYPDLYREKFKQKFGRYPA